MEKKSLNPGIMDYLKEAKKREIKTAIASSSRREWVMDHFKRLGISEYFSVLKNSDDVENIKPSPDIYLEAIKDLGVQNSEAVAVEDSFIGVKAAKNAGLFCIFIPNSLNKGMKSEDADMQLSSLKDLPFDDLVKMF